jgi:hypothetical protein
MLLANKYFSLRWIFDCVKGNDLADYLSKEVDKLLAFLIPQQLIFSAQTFNHFEEVQNYVVAHKHPHLAFSHMFSAVTMKSCFYYNTHTCSDPF